MAESVALRAGHEAEWVRFRELIAMSPEAAQWADSYPSLVAEWNGNVVGFALYRIVAGEGELLNLAVEPGARRGGIGAALMEGLFELCAVWHLEVRQSNRAAIGLYERVGFLEVGRRAGYYSDGEAAVLFRGIRGSV